MAYDEPGFGWRDDDPRDRDPRDIGDPPGYGPRASYADPDFPDRGYPEIGYPAAGAASYDRLDSFRDPPQRRTPPPAMRPPIDPDEDEPEFTGRDRLIVHVVVEGALLVAAALVAALIYRRNPAELRGDSLNSIMIAVAGLALLAMAAGLSLRVHAVNLAIGPIAAAAGLHFAEQGDHGVANAAGTAAAVAAALGLVIGLFVVGVHVPGWAASLGGAAAAMAFLAQRTAPVSLQGGYQPADHAATLLAGVAAISVVGGLLGLAPGMRNLYGRYRPTSDPALRRGTLAGVVVLSTYVLTSALAAVGGVILTAGAGHAVNPRNGMELTVLAIGAALLGGTSAYGRRAGVFGTLLAVVVLTLVHQYLRTGRFSGQMVLGTGAVLLGLAATRFVEWFSPPLTDDEQGDPPAVGPRDPLQDSWTAKLSETSEHGRRWRGR